MSNRRWGLTAAALVLALAAPGARAQDDLAKKVEQLSKEVAELKKAPAAPSEAEPKREWLTWGGDLTVRHDVLLGHIPAYTQLTLPGGVPTFTNMPANTVRNDSLLTNRFGFNMHAQPMEGVSFTARLLAYKIFGMQDGGATQANFFGDRQNVVFDGTTGHVPQDSILRVDQAYASVKDLFDLPIWFSAGRRPSTGGAPTNIRQDREVNGAAGIPGLLIDYAFDGATLGVAPEISALPGFAAKVCYGRGFESGFSQTGSATPRDTDMLGLAVLAYETPDARVDVQYLRGFHMMDAIPGPSVRTNLGDIEEFGGSAIRTLRDVGPVDVTGFFSGALSAAIPSGNRMNIGFGPNNPGMLCSGPDCGYKSGWAGYVGGRVDVKKTKTKVGAEFNHGSPNWITFVPAGDDIWTSKLGTRGNVYEFYAIQDLGRAPIARDGRVFVRVGWQYYDFQYTGTNSWIGTPQKMSSVIQSPANAQFMPPLKNAYDVYTSFEVRF